MTVLIHFCIALLVLTLYSWFYTIVASFSVHLINQCNSNDLYEVFVICRWQPQETQESLDKYIYALQNSDLTLNPVGMNAECYRIYEAMSYGSVPVIEDRSTSFSCGGWSKFKGSSATSGVFRLLKKYQAPVIFINDWRKLPELLQIESKMSRDKVIARRKEIVEWYRKFRRQMRDRLVNVVQRNMVSWKFCFPAGSPFIHMWLPY